MRKLWVVPIESLVERYSFQWNNWFRKELQSRGITFDFVDSKPLRNTIKNGSFLDVVGTNYFKSRQMARLCRYIDNGLVHDEDVILFHDLWFPGLESLAYIRDGLDLKFKVGGYFHAGTYDPFDFLTQKGMGLWGKPLENCWLSIADFVLSSTEFNKQLILKRRNALPDKIHVVGYPWYPNDFVVESTVKENIVVFPHRLNSEKNPQLFDKLKEDLQDEFPDWQFLKTKEVCATKKEYYKLLGRSKIAVSFADQETCGIAMAEAIMSGCIPVVPDHLAYRELYEPCFRYKTYETAYYAAREVIKSFMIGFTPAPSEALPKNKHKLIQMGETCIDKILQVVDNL